MEPGGASLLPAPAPALLRLRLPRPARGRGALARPTQERAPPRADRVLDAAAALRRIELPPRGILPLEVRQRMEGRNGGLERRVQGHDPCHDLLADHTRA